MCELEDRCENNEDEGVDVRRAGADAQPIIESERQRVRSEEVLRRAHSRLKGVIRHLLGLDFA